MLKVKKVIGATTALALASFCMLPNAKAVEHLAPYLSGVSTGIPTGALPPSGWYFSNDTYFVSGQIVNNEGHDIGVKELEAANSAGIMWVAPEKILGASYAAAIRQSYAFRGIQVPGGASENNEGFFNTIVSPVTLSWALPNHLHNAVGLTIYIPDGSFRKTVSTRSGPTYGQEVVSGYSYANHFWTFQPNYAISYLNKGWDLTLNTLVDFNTKNNVTDYQSGDVVYFDGTISKKIGNLTLGVVGNYTTQFTKDSLYGSSANTAHDGNKFSMALLGPMASYQFGKVNVMLRWLAPVYTRNTLNATFVHLSMGFKF